MTIDDDDTLAGEDGADIIAAGGGSDDEDDQTDGEGAGEDNEDGGGDPSDVERIAAKMGWAPQDKWRGPEDQWVDAETFLIRGPDILKQTLTRQDRQLAEMKDTIDRMARVSETAGKRAYDQAMADLKAQQREAVEKGDTDAYDDVTDRMEELAKDAPGEKKTDGDQPNPDEDPHFKSWHNENDWYGADGDPKMTLYAEKTLAPVLGRKYQGAEFYAKITEGMKKEFPEHFGGTKTKRRAPDVAGGSGRSGNGSGGNGAGKGWDSLPREAKEAGTKFINQGLYKDKADYASEYWKQEA